MASNRIACTCRRTCLSVVATPFLGGCYYTLCCPVSRHLSSYFSRSETQWLFYTCLVACTHGIGCKFVSHIHHLESPERHLGHGICQCCIAFSELRGWENRFTGWNGFNCGVCPGFCVDYPSLSANIEFAQRSGACRWGMRLERVTLAHCWCLRQHRAPGDQHTELRIQRLLLRAHCMHSNV